MHMYASVSHTYTHGVRGIHIFHSASVLATGVISVSKQTFLFYIYREGCMNHSANVGGGRLLGCPSSPLGNGIQRVGLGSQHLYTLSHLTDAKVSSPSLCTHAFHLCDEASRHGLGTLSVSVRITGVYPPPSWDSRCVPSTFYTWWY